MQLENLVFLKLKIPDSTNNTQKHVARNWAAPQGRTTQSGSNKRSISWALQNNTGPTEAKPPAEVRRVLGPRKRTKKHCLRVRESVESILFQCRRPRHRSLFASVVETRGAMYSNTYGVLLNVRAGVAERCRYSWTFIIGLHYFRVSFYQYRVGKWECLQWVRATLCIALCICREVLIDTYNIRGSTLCSCFIIIALY